MIHALKSKKIKLIIRVYIKLNVHNKNYKKKILLRRRIEPSFHSLSSRSKADTITLRALNNFFKLGEFILVVYVPGIQESGDRKKMPFRSSPVGIFIFHIMESRSQCPTQTTFKNGCSCENWAIFTSLFLVLTEETNYQF